MTDDLRLAEEDDFGGHSLFPVREPPSICSRPTPIVPARNDLLAFRSEPLRPELNSSSPPGASPSSRPTLTPEDLGIVSPLSGLSDATADGPKVAPSVERVSVVSVAPEAVVEIGPLVSLEPSAAPIEAAARSGLRWRLLFARLLFVVLFGAVAGLLAYAFKSQLGQALSEARALTSTK